MTSTAEPDPRAETGAGATARTGSTVPAGRLAAARTRRVLCASVLVAEALVVFFTVLVAKDLSGLPASVVVPVGLSLAVACLLVTGLLRSRWAYVLGSLLQVLLVLAGLVLPVMFGVGALFLLLWFLALYLAVRVGRIRDEQEAAAAAGRQLPGR